MKIKKIAILTRRAGYNMGTSLQAVAMSRFIADAGYRSEERRVGKECRSRWSPYH